MAVIKEDYTHDKSTNDDLYVDIESLEKFIDDLCVTEGKRVKQFCSLDEDCESCQ